jgi:membrane protein required for beta-lactamase induction
MLFVQRRIRHPVVALSHLIQQRDLMELILLVVIALAIVFGIRLVMNLLIRGVILLGLTLLLCIAAIFVKFDLAFPPIW